MSQPTTTVPARTFYQLMTDWLVDPVGLQPGRVCDDEGRVRDAIERLNRDEPHNRHWYRTATFDGPPESPENWSVFDIGTLRRLRRDGCPEWSAWAARTLADRDGWFARLRAKVRAGPFRRGRR